MARNRFTNPANGAFYDWPRNHSEEEEAGKTRNITRGPNTGNIGLIKTQGDDGPMLLRYRGFIVHRAQYIAMWSWYKLCRTQTIYFTDFDGQVYEVQITSFTPKRVRKHQAVSPDATMKGHYYEYGIEMEVYRFVTGDLATLGVTP